MDKKQILKQKHIILAALGLLTVCFTLAKYIIEASGAMRANTFGYIQAGLLIGGLLLLAAALVLRPGERQNNFRSLNHYLLVIFALLITLSLPGRLSKAEEADIMYDGKVATIGDDLEYQVLAVNMLYGEGFSPAIALPLETYNLDLTKGWGVNLAKLYQTKDPVLNYEDDYFFRPPGLPLILTGVYKAFGNVTLPARQTMAIITWLTGFLLLLLGFATAGPIGTLAGGVAGLYHVFYYPGTYNYEFLMTEVPAAFFATLVCLLFTLYFNKPRQGLLYIAGILLAFLGLLRPNMLMCVPFLMLIFYLKKVNIKTIALFTASIAIPVLAWSLYGTVNVGEFVTVTTQGSGIFPQFNNIDVLEGIGPDHSGQGAWQPGFVYDEAGNLIDDIHGAKEGENGWIKGFSFWFENFEELPRLFYVKLRRGFFYDNSWSVNIMHPEGLLLIGIAYILVATGFRRPGQKPCLMKKLSSRHILLLQLGLVSILLLTWNQVAFWLTAILWLCMALLSLMRPYGDACRLPFKAPDWFLAFLICHGVVTILYAGYRLHWPFDAQLILYSLLGIFMTLYELLKQKIWPAIPFVMVILAALSLHFVFIG